MFSFCLHTSKMKKKKIYKIDTFLCTSSHVFSKNYKYFTIAKNNNLVFKNTRSYIKKKLHDS